MRTLLILLEAYNLVGYYSV